MKKIVFLALVVVLAGCQKTEKETMKIVKSSLKDPDSAEFQNIKGYCGEVNARNSYGGYTGFDKFYVVDGFPVFENRDEPLEFKLGWVAHCVSDSKLNQSEKTSCASIANFSAAIVESKLVNNSKGPATNIVEGKEHAELYLKIIDNVFEDKNIRDPEGHALSVLNDCLAGKIKLPT